eukprot:gene5584-843_t
MRAAGRSRQRRRELLLARVRAEDQRAGAVLLMTLVVLLLCCGCATGMMADPADAAEFAMAQQALSIMGRGVSLAVCAQMLGISAETGDGAYQAFRRWLLRYSGGTAPRRVTDAELVRWATRVQQQNPRIGYSDGAQQGQPTFTVCAAQTAKGGHRVRVLGPNVPVSLHDTILAAGYNVTYERCREALAALDPGGALRAARVANTLQRRNFWSPWPNFTWHGDANAKLIRYGVTIFGMVDGFSRKVMYLFASNSGLGELHRQLYNLSLRIRAVELFGVPDFLRLDAGSENFAMVYEQVANMGDWIIGRSVSNIPQCIWKGHAVARQPAVPIERWWLEVRLRVTQPYLLMGEQLERAHLLNIFSPIDRTCFQLAVLNRINDELYELAQAHNCRNIRHLGRPDVLFGDFGDRAEQYELLVEDMRQFHQWSADPLTPAQAVRRQQLAAQAVPDWATSCTWVPYYLALRDATRFLLAGGH